MFSMLTESAAGIHEPPEPTAGSHFNTSPSEGALVATSTSVCPPMDPNSVKKFSSGGVHVNTPVAPSYEISPRFSVTGSYVRGL